MQRSFRKICFSSRCLGRFAAQGWIPCARKGTGPCSGGSFGKIFEDLSERSLGPGGGKEDLSERSPFALERMASFEAIFRKDPRRSFGKIPRPRRGPKLSFRKEPLPSRKGWAKAPPGWRTASFYRKVPSISCPGPACAAAEEGSFRLRPPISGPGLPTSSERSPRSSAGGGSSRRRGRVAPPWTEILL